jgi:hypothetical protein
MALESSLKMCKKFLDCMRRMEKLSSIDEVTQISVESTYKGVVYPSWRQAGMAGW